MLDNQQVLELAKKLGVTQEVISFWQEGHQNDSLQNFPFYKVFYKNTAYGLRKHKIIFNEGKGKIMEGRDNDNPNTYNGFTWMLRGEMSYQEAIDHPGKWGIDRYWLGTYANRVIV